MDISKISNQKALWYFAQIDIIRALVLFSRYFNREIDEENSSIEFSSFYHGSIPEETLKLFGSAIRDPQVTIWEDIGSSEKYYSKITVSFIDQGFSDKEFGCYLRLDKTKGLVFQISKSEPMLRLQKDDIVPMENYIDIITAINEFRKECKNVSGI